MSQTKRQSATAGSTTSCNAAEITKPEQSSVAIEQQANQCAGGVPLWRKGLKRMLSIRKPSSRRDSKLDDTTGSGPRNASEAKVAMVYSLHKRQKLEEVKEIVEKYPECLDSVNCFGQTALHVACLRGAQPDVIAYICLQHPSACSIPDETGKLPLHYLVTQSKRFFQDVEVFNPWCDDVSGANKSQSTERCIQVYLEMLRIVVKAYPQALDSEDEDETTPLETAILYEAPYRVVCTLQQYSRKLWKEHEAKKKQITSQMA